MITVTRYHDISMGHKVTGHESKCAQLHGHNYRFHFTVKAEELDAVGRVLDFGVIKTLLCQWLEDNWDHRFLIWENDPKAEDLKQLDEIGVVLVKFNPTAENIAAYFVEFIAPVLLEGENCRLIRLTIDETRKCSATYEK